MRLVNLFPECGGQEFENTMIEDVNSGMINLTYCNNNCKSTIYNKPRTTEK
jgi:hypothetical protein